MSAIVFHPRSVLKQGFFLVTCIYLVWQGFFPDTERVIPWGEALSLCLFFTIWKVDYVSPSQKRIVEMMYLFLFLVPLYGWWMTVNFWKEEYVNYYFWRSLVPFYYAVFFFYAYRWGPEILSFVKRFQIPALLSILILAYRGLGIGSSVALGLVWLALQYKNQSARFFWITYVFLTAAFFLKGHGGAGKVLMLVLLLFPLVMFLGCWWVRLRPSGPLQKILVMGLLVGTLLFIAWGTETLIGDFYSFLGAGQTQHSFSIEGIEGVSELTDASARWRLMMWAYVLRQFWEHPLGLGMGTPLFGEDMGIFFGWAWIDFEMMYYTLGAHNSFVTLLGRLGIVFLVFLLGMGALLLRNIRHLCLLEEPGRWSSEFRWVFGSLAVFLIAATQASFNMMIETPLFAAHFWFPLGLFVRLSGDIIAARALENTPAVSSPLYSKHSPPNIPAADSISTLPVS